MTLAAAFGTYITVKAQGDDALEAVNALETLIDGRFGED
jgi:phosphotransferase system HPr-like phosphotransfer protein